MKRERRVEAVPVEEKQKRKKVVIVGAGAAGLSAARSLAELSGEVDVVVLEGRDRTGGRIETTRLPDGTRVDKGASFIHGCNREDNWVFNLANELSNVTLAREYGGYQAGWLTDALWYDLQGKRVAKAELARAWSVFEAVSEALSAKANELCVRGTDMSVDEFLTQHLSKQLLKKLNDLSDTAYTVFSRLVSTVWGYVGSVEKLSARLMAHQFMPEEDEEGDVMAETGATASPEGKFHQLIPDEDALVVSGYDFLIERLSRGVDIKLNMIVRTIVTSGDGARVFCNCNDVVQEFKCDAVIVAVPLGVLQGKSAKTAITFLPPLSEKKQLAIQKMQMGAENKLIMQFSSAFWPLDETPYIQCTVPGLRFLSLQHYGKEGVLVAHLCPPFSIEMDKMTDEQIKNKVLKIVKNLFGKEKFESAILVHWEITRWTTDPFSCGSYSFMPVGASFEHVHLLKQSERVLLFAGEHTSAYDAQCVTGAFDTGHEAALEAMTVLQMSKCEFCQMHFSARNSEKLCSSCVHKDIDKAKFCVCKKRDDGREYVQCVQCTNWFHLDCVGLSSAPVDDFSCMACNKKSKRSKGNAKD